MILCKSESCTDAPRSSPCRSLRESRTVEGFFEASALMPVGRGRSDSLMSIFWSDVKIELLDDNWHSGQLDFSKLVTSIFLDPGAMMTKIVGEQQLISSS